MVIRDSLGLLVLPFLPLGSDTNNLASELNRFVVPFCDKFRRQHLAIKHLNKLGPCQALPPQNVSTLNPAEQFQADLSSV